MTEISDGELGSVSGCSSQV